MTFRKGESGNPKGRPKGTGPNAKFRNAIEQDLPEIISAMVSEARNGDVAAAKLLMDRTIPAVKPVDSPVTLPLSGGLTASSYNVLSAIGEGLVSPDQGSKLLQGLATAAGVEDLAVLRDRLEAIERIRNSRGDANA